MQRRALRNLSDIMRGKFIERKGTSAFDYTDI